jgi:SAM-dependent methyltransferase
MNYEAIVQEVIDLHAAHPVDILGNGNGASESLYLAQHRDSYVRTIRDIDGLFRSHPGPGRRILEIGSYLGPVCLSLKRMGYEASALDLPEFHASAPLRMLYERAGVPYAGVNLRTGSLPYPADSFDAVVICEVIEHLNFNPLPLLRDINRVLRHGGYLYIGMPNLARLSNRLQLLLGGSIGHRIEEYFQQLDRRCNMIVGLHWREYTIADTRELIGRMGFDAVQSYFFAERHGRTGAIRAVVRRLAYLYGPFRPFQVVIGRKRDVPVCDFWRTNASD